MTYEENYRAGEEYSEGYATDERILDGELLPSDENENILRPTTLDEYVGQDKIKDNLRIFIQAARKRGEALDHVLLYGPPGLGKTTLSKIIANEMGVEIKSTSGPAIERSADLVANLTALPANSVMFIDEIHRLNHTYRGSASRPFRYYMQARTLYSRTTRTDRKTFRVDTQHRHTGFCLYRNSFAFARHSSYSEQTS